MSLFTLLMTVLGASQLYWAARGYGFLGRWIASRGRRLALCGAVLAVYAGLFAFNFGAFARRYTPLHLTLTDGVLVAPFWWWAVSSLLAFFLMLPFEMAWGVAALAKKFAAGDDPPASPERRLFLGRTAAVVAAAPFVADGYGLLYGRLNLETTEPAIHLPRLPRAFDGFRICQLSDIHIGPFMTGAQIRKFVDIANALRPDLTVLTGDFVTFDPRTQRAVVEALSGLRAPFGIYGCLGNHDAWTRVEDSITALFTAAGVRMLRGEAVPIAMGADALQLIGVDFQSKHQFGPSAPVARVLWNIERFIERDRVNILLSHNPDTFPRAAELAIDLSMAGHTHGGQLALEFISPEIAPSRLVTPYVAGLFARPGGQLYVNRGIGTIGVPIRVGAPPEITLYKLTRGV